MTGIRHVRALVRLIPAVIALNLLQGQPAQATPLTEPSTIEIQAKKPVIIAVRKVKNLAGRYAEEGRDADNKMIGFWKPSYEIRLAEMLANELANTGNFNIVEREKLYEVFEEQSLTSTGSTRRKLTQASHIVIASLSDFIPNTAGERKNQAGRIFFVTFANDREKVDTYIAFDLRVINTSTGAITLSRTIEGISSSTRKSDSVGMAFFGAGGGGSTVTTEDNTPVSRAIRAAMVNIVDYLDCHLYKKDACINEFAAADKKRRESTKGSLNIF